MRSGDGSGAAVLYSGGFALAEGEITVTLKFFVYLIQEYHTQLVSPSRLNSIEQQVIASVGSETVSIDEIGHTACACACACASASARLCRDRRSPKMIRPGKSV